MRGSVLEPAAGEGYICTGPNPLRKGPTLDQDAPNSPPPGATPLRLLVVAARRDPEAAPLRIMAAAAEDPGLEARLLCGADGQAPPPGMRLFQPFPDGSFLAEAEPGFDATEHSQRDADLLRRLGAWLSDWAPQIVHLHDIAPFGLEFIGLIRRHLPAAPILLSLRPALAARLGLTGPARGFLEQAPLRRFLAEATLLLPCESLLPACLEFGLEPARLLVHPPLPRALPECPLPPLGRFLVVAAYPAHAAERALLTATEALLARFPGAPLLQIADPAAPRHAALEGAHLLLLPDPQGADPESLARLALALGRPVICAGHGPLARQVQPGRDGWHAPMNPTALADLLLGLAEAPQQVAAMAAAILPPPSPAEGAAALFALYREALADPARVAPPERI
jgi:hypothetical protein